MAANEYFALIDYADGTSKDVPLSAIVSPRQMEYDVGQKVKARYPRFKGTHDGVVAAVSEDREWLRAHLKDPRPLAMPESTECEAEDGATPIESESEDGATPIESEEEESATPIKRPRKRIAPRLPDLPEDDSLVEDSTAADQAKTAKKAKRVVQRAKETTKQKTNNEETMTILNEKQILEKLNQIEAKVQFNHRAIMERLEKLCDAVQCKDCIKSMYKAIKKSEDAPALPQSPPTKEARQKDIREPAATEEPATCTIEPPSTANKEPGATPTPSTPTTHKPDSQESAPPAIRIQSPPPQQPANDEDLVFLGEAKYGVQMRGKDLLKCQEQASTPEALALNLIEFTVTREASVDMTVNGRGKGKKEMAPNLRGAIKSQVYQMLPEKDSKGKKDYWEFTVVKKMNDKIRGIRNGKYKSKV